MRIAFWNVNNSSLVGTVSGLAEVKQPDVICLLESQMETYNLINAIYADTGISYYGRKILEGDRFQFLLKDRSQVNNEVHVAKRFSVRIVNIGKKEHLLVFVHGPDARNNDEDVRRDFACDLSARVSELKGEFGCVGVVIMGDLNVNPYDRCMNSPKGYNAMMTMACAERKTRQFNENAYELYYNPMWSLFGDRTDGPAGTIYDTSGQGPYGWSMFDQVLFDSDSMNYFRGVEIVDRIKDASLVTGRGIPDKRKFSDHLPILVEFGDK